MIFIVDEVKNFAANNLFQVGELVTYWDPCNKKCGVHILKSLDILKRWKVSAMSSSTGIVEFRDKSFVLDLKLLFTIVNCFSGTFPPRFLTVKLVFLGHHILSYLFFRCMILTWYWYLFVLTSFKPKLLIRFIVNKTF